jgi:hypothetical protein
MISSFLCWNLEETQIHPGIATSQLGPCTKVSELQILASFAFEKFDYIFDN